MLKEENMEQEQEQERVNQLDEETGLPIEWRMIQDQATKHYYYFNFIKNSYYPYLPPEVIASIPVN